MDRNKYNYLEFDIPNVYLTVPKASADTPDKHTIDPKMRALLVRLSRRKPKWKFASCSSPYSIPIVHKFDVFENGECLGVLDIVTRNNTPSYSIENPRISNGMQRNNNGRVTKDINRALGFIQESFYPQTDVESIRTYRSKVGEAMGVLRSKQVYPFRSLLASLMGVATTRLMENWATEGKKLLADPRVKVTQTLEEIQNMYETAQATEKFLELPSEQKLHLTLLNGKYYIEDNPYPEAPKLYQKEIGMLKLLDDGEFLPGIGLKVLHNVFVLVRKKDDNV